ncbi:MAG: 50S ribosomal protein L15e [Candidatus Diapherotrites archaeon]|uniref:50S ribosomal protein L15e n=1 Tax=Candidatus Iainarchaeum sp. TaxID=3101447 RepID=A0A2D6LPU9_9ARCH|nr:50S ribosomal protein L15e [Candidatus Diapherotrites archaeon]|tara:strand:+ start:1095 stop:1697 length:603 start_codon:yes stop_codon:yes gene_type:complete
MSLTKEIKKTIQKEVQKSKDKEYPYAELFRKKVLAQRQKKASVVRIDKPSNLPKARALGYKAKEGYIIALTRIRKGSGMHVRPKRGRRPKRMGVKKLTRRISRQVMAEQRAGRKYPNCEVMNSYWIGIDGKHTYYEVILVDVASTAVRSDKERNRIVFNKHTKRAERGLTSAGKKSRGLVKGKGHEKNFPSIRAKGRKSK